ncbi:DNA translocase FtsK [Aridibaculum aurantiacum]|uniref:DNA translocase FtsK n=1 Tax=Aridibaculum aurantiacum TaxID=2810307 RepID=UPI001A9607AF|nr:DNA translocase FtsK [Aridibaculum aurantiacum]
MANTLRKKKTPPPPDPEKLVADKEEEVTVKEIVKDERTYKIAGTVSLLVSLFLFVALASYAFTWQDDQDKVHQFGVEIFSVDDVRVNNLLGVLGAYVAHFFIYKAFGIASFLFCTFFFVLGVNLLFGRKVFSLQRNVKYVLSGLLVISVLMAFIFRSSAFSFGGAVGQLVSEWLVKWIGNVGTGLLLLVTGFSYFVWRFNPKFTWPDYLFNKPTIKPAATSTAASVGEMHVDGNGEITETPLHEAGVKTVHELYLEEKEEADESAKLYIEKDVAHSNNKLKNNGKGVVVMMPDEPSPVQNVQLEIIEKDEPEEEPFVEEEEEIELGEEVVAEEEEMPTNQIQLEVEPANIVELVEMVTADAPPPPVSKRVHVKHPDPVVEEMELEIKDTTEVAIEEEEEEIVLAKPTKMDPYEPKLDLRDYKYPSLELLETHGSEKIVHDPVELENNKNQIINTLKNYDITIQRIAATVGPTVTLYEIVPAPGVRISRIKNLEDDIALNLAALGIRIIAPIPGKGTIGIEVPNVRKTVVSMKTLLASEKFQNSVHSLPIAIGKRIDNELFIVDLATMPHLLMAGATGQGKSVGLNAILVSLLYKKHPSQLKFVLVDPKKVELSIYRSIEKHFLAKLPGEEESIITDTKKVVHTLNALCIEMDNRYDLLKEAGCRNIKEYNEKFIARRLNPEKGHQFLPFIVLVVDEFADLIMTAGKEVEMPIARLAQLARAIGIHLIIATQRPSVNIITGTIKANFPARIAFKVSSKIDSRTILDAGGAEQLIGKGDMLINYNGELTRLQCAFVDTPEVDAITDFIGDQRGYPQAFLLPEYVDEKELETKDFDSSSRDPLFEDAARLVVSSQIGSTSLIQRRMKLGYNRAGRLMDQLEAAGIVGPNMGSKAREVQVKSEMELEEILGQF